jgi:hypothetical protein
MEKKNPAILLQDSTRKKDFEVVVVCTDSQDVINNNSNVKLFMKNFLDKRKGYLITYRSSSYLQDD